MMIMYFERSIHIDRPPADVFCFLRDKDKYPQEAGSPVLVLEQTTPGPVAVGTRYREVVQMLPFKTGEICSEITRYEPPTFLEEDFHGAGMMGHLAYEFRVAGAGTLLVQRETLHCTRLLTPLAPLIRWLLLPRIEQRLKGIKAVLEGGWEVRPL